MKKRLLSAALALAMVLTLLPLTVFATPASDVTSATVYYYAKGAKPSDAKDDFSGTDSAGGWFVKGEKDGNNKYEYTKKTDGLVNTTNATSTNGGNATWYSGIGTGANNVTSLGLTSIALLGDVTLDINAMTTTSTVTVNVNGHILTVASDGTENKTTGLKVYDDSAKTGGVRTGKMTGTLSVSGRSFTFTNGENNANDTKSVAKNSSALVLTLNNSTTDDLKKRSDTLTVNVYGDEVGAVTATYAKVTVNANYGAKIASVITSDGSSGSNAKTGGSITLGNKSEVTDTVGIYGPGTISLTGRSKITGITTLYGDKKAADDKFNSWKTTVTVDNSTMGAINQGANDENGHKIDIKNNSTVASIDMSIGAGGSSDIDISGSNIGSGTGTVALIAGTVDITNSKVGNITTGKSGVTSGTTITVGTRNQADTSVVGNIAGKEAGAASPTLILNSGKVGTIGGDDGKDLVAVSKEVYGGSAKTAIPQADLKNGLDKGYQIYSDTTEYYTYTTKFQDVIDATRNAAERETITTTLVGETLGENEGDTVDITFQWDAGSSSETLTVITINKGHYLDLPTEVNGNKVQYWYDTTDDKDPSKEGLKAGISYVFDDDTTLSSMISANPNQKLTGVKAVDKTDSAPITATISGYTINLSGALSTNGVTGQAIVTLEIDNDEDGPTFNVGWHSENGTITLSKGSGSGITFPISRSDQVQIFDTPYTVTGNGLKAKVSKVVIKDLSGSNTMPITVSNANGGMRGSYEVTGQNLKTKFEDSTNSNVSFADADGVKAALNAVVAGLSESQRDTIINSARNAAASYHNKEKTDGKTDHKASEYTEFDTVELSPYLDIVAAGNPVISGSGNPTITLTITLKYRYKVKNGSNEYAPKEKNAAGTTIPWEQTSNLSVSGDCGKVTITLKMPEELVFAEADDADAATSFAHHDGCVYPVIVDENNVLTIDNLNGFASTTFEINNTKGNVTVQVGKDPDPDTDRSFDSLQAAVDAVKNNGYIIVNDNFNGSINVSGQARKFTIKAAEGKTVTLTAVNGASTTSDYNTSSKEYVIQLTQDNVVTVTTATISVSFAPNGAASAGVSTAKSGDTVIGTIKPSNGYKAGTFTATAKKKDGSSTSVSVSVNTTSNTFSFVVPADATSVTVTPSFVVDTGLPFTDVQFTDSYYMAVKWNYDNNFVKGTTTTTFGPTGNVTRAQVVTILYRNAGSPTVDVSTNPYTDINISSVDAEMQRAIIWATQKNIVQGYGNGKFGPSNPVRNQELAKILYTYNQYRGRTSTVPTSVNLDTLFTDASNISDWAVPYVKWAVGNGVMSAVTGKQFLPQLQLQRWQVTVDVYNYGLRFGA